MHSYFLILVVYAVVFECLGLQCLVLEGGKAKNEGGENEKGKTQTEGDLQQLGEMHQQWLCASLHLCDQRHRSAVRAWELAQNPFMIPVCVARVRGVDSLSPMVAMSSYVSL